MKTTLKILIAALLVAAAATGARAGEDAWKYRHLPFPGATQNDDDPQPAPATPARKTVSQDDRITDGTTDFDTSLYPKGPVAQLVFWGFEGAKTDYSKAEDAFCDQDVAVLSANMKKAAAGMPAQNAAGLSIAKKVLTKTVTYCPDAGEGHSGTCRAQPECEKVQESHCAAVLRSASPRLALRYVELQPLPSKSACSAVVAAAQASDAVIDSHVKPGPKAAGCVVQLLEIVAR